MGAPEIHAGRHQSPRLVIAVAVFFLAFIPTALAVAQPDTGAGATPIGGQPLVSAPTSNPELSGGAFTFEIPLRAPSTLSGLVPRLSLTYNSNDRNGDLGVGWRIAGLSSIERCTEPLGVRGLLRGVRYVADDPLCLDRQRLLLLS